MASLTERMLGAAKLDAATYEEVEADATATPQAMLVVVLASVAGGVGAMRGMGVGGLLLAALASLIGWYVWAFITYFVGTRILPGAKTQADVGQLLRTIGFSATPGLIRVLEIIPGLGTLVVPSSPPCGCWWPWSWRSARLWTTSRRAARSVSV